MAENEAGAWQPGVEPSTREEAIELLCHLSAYSGIVPESVRSQIPARVLAMLAWIQKHLSTTAVKLSADLYISDSRFLYELIQNADDNCYEKAQNAPTLTLTLKHDQLVLDSNEDGFKRRHVESMSRIGESTKQKTTNHGYIGEKGIGFKSVFKVADKVHIKSEPYSFSFHYERDTELGGLGMIAPLPQAYTDMPEQGTQIILSHFHETDFEALREELELIPDTLLLFLRQLTTLVVRIKTEAGVYESRWSKRAVVDGIQEIHFQKSLIENNSSTITNSKILRFIVKQKLVTHLSPDAARRSSDGQFITNASIVLAFPLDVDDSPHIEEQYTYAFLPIRKVGFSFLIQSDFVMQSSREDVLHTSARNKALRARIPGIFGEAMRELCSRNSLKYTWMRYLPEFKPSTGFWEELGQDIRQLMSQQAVLESLSGYSLSALKSLFGVHLKQPLSSFMFESETPLLRGNGGISLLSLKYAPKDCAILQGIGLSVLTYKDIVELLRYDLTKENCWWKSSDRSGLWQSKLSSLLLQICKASAVLKKELQSMSIVELDDDSWTGTDHKKIYMPSSDSAPVPVDLGFNIVNSNNVVIEERTALIIELGVQFADTKEIIDAIYTKHLNDIGQSYVSDKVSHFVYLFWHEQTKDSLPDYIRLSCSDGYGYKKSKALVFYDDSDSSFGPRQLFKQTEEGNLQAPGHKVHYLHDLFYGAVPDGVGNDNGLSWREWLVKFCGVADKPRLSIPSNGLYKTEIAPEMAYIIENRSDILVPFIEHHKDFYNSIPAHSLDKFGSAKVWNEQKELIVLREGVLPTTELRAMTKSLEIPSSIFLHTGSESNDVDPKEWDILDQFHVIKTADLWFFVACLQAICRDPNRVTRSIESVAQVYTHLQKEYKMAFESKFRKMITDLSWICVYSQGDSSTWVTVADCLWQGPSWLRYKHVLKNIKQYESMDNLFGNAVGLRNYRWSDAIEELETMKAQNEADYQKAASIYQELEREFASDANPKALRDKLEEGCLILSDSGWIQPSVCLWAPKKIQIAGRVSVAERYSTLEGFFLKTLDVEKPDIELHVTELRNLAKSRAPFSRMKDVMENISQLGPVQDSLRSRFDNLLLFPTIERDGSESMAFLSSVFAIVDKPRYAGVFNRKMQLLKLSQDDLWKIKHFLIACGLIARFLSEIVVDKTTVDHAVVSQTLTQNFRTTGYAFLRYAVHFRSSKTQDGHKGLFEALQKITVYKSDSISKVWTITQADETISIPCSSADLHFAEESDLCIYVPKDEPALERCWPNQLIDKLRTWLGVTDKSGDMILQSILFRSKENQFDALDDDLEYHGIRVVEGIDRSSFASHINNSIKEDESALNCSTLSCSISESPDHTGNDSSLGAPARSPPHTPSVEPQDDLAQKAAYRKVLDSIIQAAQDPDIRDTMDHEAPVPPIIVQNNIGELLKAFGPALVNGQPNLNHHKKVDVAGELFVVEILKRICGSKFSNESWQSASRHEVNIHEKYANLDRWPGRVTSNVVYNDTSGTLTQELIACGHLDPQIWTDGIAKYYIEVKTTTGPYNDPFYVSSNQLSGMKSARLIPGSARADVHVIMRVFNLGQPDNISLRVYVDPYSAKKSGELLFHSDKYTVLPGRVPDDPDGADYSSDSDAEVDS